MNVALFGAAGAIGPVVASELLARGHSVRAVGRNEAKLRAAIPGAEPCVADLQDPAGASRASAGVDAIVYAVGVPYDRFDLHPAMMRVALAAAREAGVTRFFHISNVYPYGRPQTPLVSESHPLAPHTRKGQFRKEQEDLVSAAHDPGGMRTVILRPPDFFGPTAENSVAAFALASIAAGKPADLLAPVSTPHEYAYVPDLGPVIVDLLERPELFGTAYNVAGSGATTELAFAAKLFAAAGKPLRYRAAGPLLLRALGLFNPLMRELAEMSYLHETPVLLDESKLRAALGTVHKTSYDDGIRATVAAFAARGRAA